MATTTAIPELFSKKLTPEQIQIVKTECADKLGIPVNWVLAVYYFETAGTFSTTAENQIGSVGLIQFTRDKAGVNYKTLAGHRFYLSEIKAMSFFDQVRLSYLYWREAKGKKTISSFTDLYMLTFFPLALGWASNKVLSTSSLSASLIAKQNPAFDQNKDGQITVGEVTDFFRKKYNSLGLNFDKYIGGSNSFPLILVIIGLFFSSFVNVKLNLLS